jgi:hypothetical protein
MAPRPLLKEHDNVRAAMLRERSTSLGTSMVRVANPRSRFELWSFVLGKLSFNPSNNGKPKCDVSTN